MPNQLVEGWVVSIASKPDLKFHCLVDLRFNDSKSAQHFAEGYVLGRDSGFEKQSESAGAITWESSKEVLRVDTELKFAEQVSTGVWPSEK
jgi:hypothetical protein